MAAEQVIANQAQPKPDADSSELGPLTRLKYMMARGFLWAWARCFSLKGLYLFGQFFGTLEYLINYKRRRKFRERFNQTFGQYASQISEPVWRICWQHVMRTRCDKLFYLIFDKLPREKIINRIKYHNREFLDEGLKRGKGAYVLMSHNGSHHVAILLMALMGYKVAGVRDPNEGNIRRYIQERYEETFPEFRDIRMFYADTFPRDLYRCFQEGFILGSALDVSRMRGVHLKTAKVTLFGQEREFLTGTMQIALRCGAPIIQGFVVSRENFYFHLIGTPPLVDPDIEKDTPEILQAAMQKYADNIADHLLKHPDHISKA
jgi:lauroyl/myristoyl acyltransferase